MSNHPHDHFFTFAPAELDEHSECLWADQIESLAIALLDFRSPAEVATWLAAHPASPG